MKTEIDRFDSASGWVPDSGSGITVALMNEHPDFIAHGLSQSTVFYFPAGSSTKGIKKTLAAPISMSGHDEIIVSIFSVRLHKSVFDRASDFNYILELASGKQYLIPTWETFTQISIPVTDLTTVDYIKVIANTDGEDYLAMSYMIAARDEVPADIYDGFKEGLEAVRAELFPYGGKAVGTVTASAGDRTITIAGDHSFVQRNALLLICDSVNSEKHLLIEGKEAAYKLGQPYDGPEMLNNYTAAQAYIYYPIEYGRLAVEAIFPSISIWGFTPTPIQRVSLKDESIKGYKAGSFLFKQGGFLESWRIMIDSETTSPELLADLTTIIRRFLARNNVWINGRNFDFIWQEIPVEVEAADALEIIPRMQYQIDVEIVEDIMNNLARVPATDLNVALGFKERS